MRNTRTIAGAVLAAAVLGLGWLSCSGKQNATTTPDAAAGAAGSGGAGAGGSGGSVATGGSGGTAGSGGSAGTPEWGAAPDWEATTLTPAGCPIERLANAPQVRFFKWKPCSWSPNDCEEAVFNPDLVGSSPNYVALASVVQDDGTAVRVGLEFELPGEPGLFATAEGQGLAGLRSASSATKCGIGGVSVYGNRFGVELYREVKQYTAEYGGVLGDLDGPAKSQLPFTASQVNPNAIVQGEWLGSARWIWWLASYGYGTVSATDGSSYTEFVTMQSPGNFVYLGQPITTGKLFLFGGFVGDDAGMAHGNVYYSDGIAAPQVYIEPTEPDTYYGRPIYANSYVGFFKGIGFKDVNVYNSVELWASPYSEDPSKLKPVKLAALPYKGMPVNSAGGWGHAAFGGPTKDKAAWVWNLATGAQQTFPFPQDYRLSAFLGVSRQHVWVSGSILGGATPYLIRFRLQ